MTNRELYNKLAMAFPDVVGGYWSNFPYTKYSKGYLMEKLTAIESELGCAHTYCMTMIDLTQRQVYLANAVIDMCKESNEALKGDAIHQLADCIDNFNEESREITTNEHVLYSALLNLLIKTLQSCAM